MSELIQIKFTETPGIDLEAITDMLPEWKTEITHAEIFNRDQDLQVLKLTLKIEATSVEDVTKWLQVLQDRTKTTYTVRSTDRCKGAKVAFKQRLVCQHKTACKRLYDSSIKNNTKNTDCPSQITITLRPAGDTCEILFTVTHNHETDSPDMLKFRPVSEEVAEKLVDLYKRGHTPASALGSIKADLRLTCENYEEAVKDRRFCPDYRYCHRIYCKNFQGSRKAARRASWDVRRRLEGRLSEFNLGQGDKNSARIQFDDHGNYVICICPPLFKRVHQHVKSSSEVVLLDSTTFTDQGRPHKIFTFLTDGQSGGLPLAIAIISRESKPLIKASFELLKDMTDDTVFCGNPQGPKILLLSENSDVLREIAAELWPRSAVFISVFGVLQTVWKFLVKPKHSIAREKQIQFIDRFREILYADTISEGTGKFLETRGNADSYLRYCKVLDEFWKMRDLWVLYYRNNIAKTDTRDKNVYSFEAQMKFIKDKILEPTGKGATILQLVDCICTNFLKYYETRLLELSESSPPKVTNVLEKLMRKPPEGWLDRVSFSNETTVLVPSQTINSLLFYLVSLDSLICSCADGKNGKVCKHLDWACMYFFADKSKLGLSPELREIYYQVATGHSLSEH